MTDFNIAENYQGGDGKQYTQFYKVSIWDKRGANMEKYLTKGRPLYLEGRVRGRGYLTQTIVDQIVDAVKKGEDWRKIPIPCQLEMANPRVTFITANKTAQAEEPVTTVPEEDLLNEKPF